MTNETTAPERLLAHAFWSGNQYYCRFSAKDRSEKDFGQTEYVRADALEAAQARIAELEADRDKWQVAFGHVLSAIPLPDVIRASGSVRDLIDYLKEELNG